MSPCDTTDTVIRIPHVESDVSDHCNLSCSGCNHFAPMFRQGFYNLHDFKADLKALQGVLHAHSWYLLGGEPLLNPRLTDYARALRDSGVCTNVVLWTNGLLLPDWQDTELFPLLSSVIISKYPMINYTRLDDWLAKDIMPGKVRVQIVGRFIHSLAHEEQSPGVAQETFDTCKQRKTCNVVYRGKYYLCPQSARMPAVLSRRDFHDGCDLHGEDLGRRLREHLADKRTCLDACRFCRSHRGPSLNHRQEPVSPRLKVGYP